MSSSVVQWEETINTLKYAQQARKIKNVARKNVDEKNSKQLKKLKLMAEQLQEEVDALKLELEKEREKSSEPGDEEPKSLVYELRRFSMPELYKNSVPQEKMEDLEFVSKVQNLVLQKDSLVNFKERNYR